MFQMENVQIVKKHTKERASSYQEGTATFSFMPVAPGKTHKIDYCI